MKPDLACKASRLTAWELSQYKIPYDIISDNAAGYFLKKGEVNKVLYGGDRVARNGDVANKIGSYMLALAANAQSCTGLLCCTYFNY